MPVLCLHQEALDSDSRELVAEIRVWASSRGWPVVEHAAGSYRGIAGGAGVKKDFHFTVVSRIYLLMGQVSDTLARLALLDKRSGAQTVHVTRVWEEVNAVRLDYVIA